MQRPSLELYSTFPPAARNAVLFQQNISGRSLEGKFQKCKIEITPENALRRLSEASDVYLRKYFIAPARKLSNVKCVIKQNKKDGNTFLLLARPNIAWWSGSQALKKLAVQQSHWLRIRNWEGKPAFLRVDTGCEGFFLFGSPWIAVGWTECSYYNIPLGRLALFCYFLPSEIFRDFLTNLYQTKFPWLWLTYSVKAKIQIAERFSHPE